MGNPDSAGRQCIYARRVWARGGELFCEDQGGRVIIAGYAVKHMEGAVTLP